MSNLKTLVSGIIIGLSIAVAAHETKVIFVDCGGSPSVYGYWRLGRLRGGA